MHAAYLALEQLALNAAALLAAVPCPIAAHAAHEMLRAVAALEQVPHHLEQALRHHARLGHERPTQRHRASTVWRERGPRVQPTARTLQNNKHRKPPLTNATTINAASKAALRRIG